MEENVATLEVTENRKNRFRCFRDACFFFPFMRRIMALKRIEHREIMKVDKYKDTFPYMK